MKDFLSLKGLKKEEIMNLIDLALRFKKSEIGFYSKAPKNIIKVFLEPSTRTSLSFEVAAKNLGINISQIDSGNSSISKGESLLDTFLNLEALGFEAAIIRIKEEGLLKDLSEKLNLKIICAGEGRLNHPSQGLLDGLTIFEEFNSLDGLKIGVVGDINHSRVASSLVDLFENFDSDINVFQPLEFGDLRDQKFQQIDLNQLYESSDAVILLRNQFERHGKELINKEKYLDLYGLNSKRLELLKQSAIIMHPGPMHIGVEISKEAIEDSRSRIYQQVKNGVFARMAILKEVFHG